MDGKRMIGLAGIVLALLIGIRLGQRLTSEIV